MSSRKNRSPEEQARQAKIRELLQESNISSMEDIQNLFKETIAEFMENGLDAELDDELGYLKLILTLNSAGPVTAREFLHIRNTHTVEVADNGML